MVSPQPPGMPAEEEPLPDFELPDYDLSASKTEDDSTYENVPKGSQIESDDDPEGIFDLYDSEFEDRRPAATPDDEFLENFGSMFDVATQGEDIPGLSNPGEGDQSYLDAGPEPETLAEDSEELSSAPVAAEELILEDPNSFDEALPDPTTYELDGWDEEEYSTEPPLNFEENLQSQELSPEKEHENFLDDGLLSSDLEEDFDGEELEEISFDSDDSFDGEEDSEFADEDEQDFEEFIKLATGKANPLADEFELEETDEVEDDFSLEDIDGEDEAIDADPFGELDIIDGEDKDHLEETELELDEIAEPSVEQAFENGDSDFGTADGYDPLTEIDPLSDEAMELEEAQRKREEEEDQEVQSDEADKPKKKKAKKSKRSSKRGPSRALGKLLPLVLFPWRIYGKIVGMIFGVLTKMLGILGALPFVGGLFKLAASALGAIPMAAKKAIVLLLIGGVVFGGSAAISSLLPKPSGSVELPDSGGASFEEVVLEDGVAKGTLENTGDVRVYVYPSVTPKERTLNPLSWFSPKELESCTGELQELAIGESKEISFPCAADGWLTLDVSLKEG